MEHEIVGKLKRLLSEPVGSECKVVYLLCQLRKLLDKNPPSPYPSILKVYCNWAMHADLDRKSTIGVLKEIDELTISILSKQDAKTAKTAFDHLLLERFKTDIRAALSFYQLPTTICDDNDYWKLFVHHYSGVIENGTLVYNGNELEIVNKVIFRKCDLQTDSSPILIWEIELKDKQILCIELCATPAGELHTMYCFNLPSK